MRTWRKGPPRAVGGGVDWCSHCGTRVAGPQKTTARTSMGPSSSAPGVGVLQRHLQPAFTAAVTAAETGTRPECPPMEEWMKKLWRTHWAVTQPEKRRSRRLRPRRRAWRTCRSANKPETRETRRGLAGGAAQAEHVQAGGGRRPPEAGVLVRGCRVAITSDDESGDGVDRRRGQIVWTDGVDRPRGGVRGRRWRPARRRSSGRCHRTVSGPPARACAQPLRCGCAPWGVAHTPEADSVSIKSVRRR